MNAPNAVSNHLESEIRSGYGLSQSQSIKSIAKAIQGVQSKMAAVMKDAKNDYFNSKYATLHAVWQTVQPLLDENQLVITQFPGATYLVGDDKYTDFEATIIHTESGEFIKGFTMIPGGKSKDKSTAQTFGSLVTYGRRYSLSSLLGIVVDDDDDGNAGSGKTSQQQHQNQDRSPQNQQRQQGSPPNQQRQQQPTGQQQRSSNQAPPNQPPAGQPQQQTALQRLGAFLKQAGCNGKEDASLLIDFIAPSHNWDTVQNEEIALFVLNQVNEGVTTGRFATPTVLQTALAAKDASAAFN